MKSKSKKSLKSSIVLLTIFISLFFNTGLITTVFTPNSVSNDSSLDNLEYTNIELNVLVPKITIKTSYSPNGEEFKQLRLHDGGNLAEVGKPRVPFQIVEILLPYGKDMRDIEVFAENWQILEGHYKIEPAQEQIPIASSKETDFAFDALFYQSKSPYPNKIYSVVGIYELRGYRILVVNLYPVKYYPNTGIISYTKEMSISVNLADSTNINTLYRNQKVDENHVLKSIKNPEVLNSYKGKIVEHNLITPKLALPPGSYDYVIITNNDLKILRDLIHFKI
jgi:hypothetical protein